MSCFMCKGYLENKETTFKVEVDRHMIIAKSVPSHICSQCGKTSYNDDGVRQLEKMAHTFKNLVKCYEGEYEYIERNIGKPVGKEILQPHDVCVFFAWEGSESMENQEVLNLVLAKLEKIEAKFDNMESRMDKMEAKIDRIEVKVNALEITVKEVHEDTKITRSAVN